MSWQLCVCLCVVTTHFLQVFHVLFVVFMTWESVILFLPFSVGTSYSSSYTSRFCRLITFSMKLFTEFFPSKCYYTCSSPKSFSSSSYTMSVGGLFLLFMSRHVNLHSQVYSSSSNDTWSVVLERTHATTGTWTSQNERHAWYSIKEPGSLYSCQVMAWRIWSKQEKYEEGIRTE